MSKVLHMQFTLDNNKTLSVKLPDPKDDIESADVEPIMEAMIEHQAFLVGTAKAASISGATIVETTTQDLI